MLGIDPRSNDKNNKATISPEARDNLITKVALSKLLDRFLREEYKEFND